MHGDWRPRSRRRWADAGSCAVVQNAADRSCYRGDSWRHTHTSSRGWCRLACSRSWSVRWVRCWVERWHTERVGRRLWSPPVHRRSSVDRPSPPSPPQPRSSTSPPTPLHCRPRTGTSSLAVCTTTTTCRYFDITCAQCNFVDSYTSCWIFFLANVIITKNNKSVFSLFRRLLTWRYPHLLLSAGLPAHAAAPTARAQLSINISCLRALSSKPDARRCWCWLVGQTDRRMKGRTLDRYINPVRHIMRAASKK